jgi:hypothetical protein
MSKATSLRKLARNKRAMDALLGCLLGWGYTALCNKLAGHAASVPPPADTETAVRLLQQHAKLGGHAWMVHDSAIDGWPGGDFGCSLWQFSKPDCSQVLRDVKRWADGADVLYKLGHGSPGWLQEDLPDQLDCSAWVALVLGRRKAGGPDWQNSKGQDWWLHTGSIYSDAKGACELFNEVETPLAGDVFTYPDSGGRQGHTGFVVDGDWPLTICDCSSSQSRRTGDAIKFRDGAWLHKKDRAIFVRPAWYSTSTVA